MIGFETDSHHISWIRDEILASISHIVFLKLNYRQCRVERKSATIIAHSHCTKSRLDIELAHGGEVTKAEWLFSIRFVRHLAIKILTSEQSRFIPISVGKCLTNLIHHRSRLLIYIPIIRCTFRCVRTASP